MAVSLIANPILLFDNKMPVDSNSTTELLTVREVATLLNISEPGVRRLMDKRLVPFFKIGGCIRFEKSDVLSYLQDNRVEAIGSK